MNKVKNFEMVENKAGLVITYPIEESNNLNNVNEVNARIVKNENNYYDIIVSTIDGLDKTIFENLDKDLLGKIEQKNVYFAGLSESTKEIEIVSKLNKLTVVKENKTTKGLM